MDEKALVQEYAQLKFRYNAAKLEFEAAEKAMKAKEQSIVALLVNRGAKQTAKYEGLGFCSLRKPGVRTANYAKEHENEFFGWIKEMGYGEIIKLSINPQTLKSAVKSMLEEGQAEEFPKYLYYETEQKLTFYDRSK